jgi:hypothetical protein
VEKLTKGANMIDNLPKPKVKLVGTDGNAFCILGRVTSALKKAGWTKEQTDEFMAEATDGDYDHLLATCMKYAETN